MTDYLIYNTPAMVCVIIAGILAAEKNESWGWFLFLGLLISVAPFQNAP